MDIYGILQQLVILAPPFLFAITFHELAHGYIALNLGDPTAKNAGRLTMNPLKHLDPLGVLVFIIMKIGWAKPVPVNPVYFRDPHKGMLLVSLAGPGANMVLAVISALLVRLLVMFPLLPMYVLRPVAEMLVASVWINVMLAVFNLLPVPPLDGSKILMGVLPRDMARSYEKLEPFGFILLLVLFYLGVISKVILPIIRFTHNFLLG